MQIVQYQVKLWYSVIMNYFVTWLKIWFLKKKMPAVIAKMKTESGKDDLKDLKIAWGSLS